MSVGISQNFSAGTRHGMVMEIPNLIFVQYNPWPLPFNQNVFPEYETILSRNGLVQDPVPVARPISSLRFSSRFPCPSSSNLSTSGKN